MLLKFICVLLLTSRGDSDICHFVPLRLTTTRLPHCSEIHPRHPVVGIHFADGWCRGLLRREVGSSFYLLFRSLSPGWSLAWSVASPACRGGRARTPEWSVSVLTRGPGAIWTHGSPKNGGDIPLKLSDRQEDVPSSCCGGGSKPRRWNNEWFLRIPGFLNVGWNMCRFSLWLHFWRHKESWPWAPNSLWCNSAFISCHPGPVSPPTKCQMLVTFIIGR